MGSIKEECGVFGIYSDSTISSAYACYNGLLALQHRGQESCGIAVSDCGVIDYYKDTGLVTEVFNNKVLDSLPGQMAVSHVRYSGAGESGRENAQPLCLRYIKGVFSIAHNGCVTNAFEIKQELERRGAIFQTTTDSEVIAYLIARERINAHSIEEAVENAMHSIKGAYSMLIMSPRKLIAARDPNGFRPLCMGKYNGSIIFASETCALDACGAEFVRDIEPGEIVVVDDKGNVNSIKTHCKGKSSVCIFEYVYFARNDSYIDGVSVYEARKISGRALAKAHPVDADVVIGVPESGIDAAIGYSEESGIPYEKGITKNNYIGRTFIRPTQEERAKGVNIKLNALKSAINGKRVVMVDDSIVRGTTCAKIVSMIRDAGAKEIHLRLSSPPFLWPCYFGPDVPTKKDLIACKYSIEEIGRIIGADSIGFLPIEALPEMLGDKCNGYCEGCFNGNYPMDITKAMKKNKAQSGLTIKKTNE